MNNEGDEPGGNRGAELTAGKETGALRDIPSMVNGLEDAKDAVPREAGAQLGSLASTKIEEKSDR